MSEIGKWLNGLGLGEYAETFEVEKIDLDAVQHLSAEMLQELGLPMGPRAKLLAAISKLEAEGKVDAKSSSSIEQLAPAQPREAERRQLTVMFCDLVGSTALAEKLDPEELRSVMTSYRKAAGDVVTRYDGHVAQYLGDGVMVYFGWPRAHEDDAERAVRAGLEIVDAIKQVDRPQPLQVRIGIATGPVVIGEGADDDAQAGKLAVGGTPNLAARLQGLASADEIVVGPGTQRLIRGAFDYDDLGPQALKGIQTPVQAWRVIGESTVEGRFEAQVVGNLTPLVGRKTEIQLLLDRWQQACDSEGQVVLLSGEPGIGKSRIAQALLERVAEQPHTCLRYQCSPYHTNSALYPMIAQLERAAGFNLDDEPDAKLDKLELLLSSSMDDVTGVAYLLAAMLSLPLDRYPTRNVSPQRQKEETIAALADQVTGLAKHNPVLMLFEDVHWCDPTSLETLGAVIAHLQDSSVLLVMTYRPEPALFTNPASLDWIAREARAAAASFAVGGFRVWARLPVGCWNG